MPKDKRVSPAKEAADYWDLPVELQHQMAAKSFKTDFFDMLNRSSGTF